MLDVPETLKFVTPLTVLPNTALPVTVSEFAAPVIVEVKVTVVPANVRVAELPLKVTAP